MCPTSQSTPKQKKSASRLQDAVRPSNYKLRIMPDISNAKFSGEETITLTIAETVKEIVLHAAEISISTAALRNHSGNTISTSVKYDEEKQQIILSLDAPAEPAEWQLELHFDGILNNKLRGFYRSTFKDASGAEKQIATTKFEPSDARRAFPCFDEPEFKAVFEISLLIDENLTAIANSPIVSETAAGSGKKLVQFAPSIKMSSYLVAYIVGEFEASAPVVSKSGTPIRVVSVPGKQHLTAFALKWAKFSLDFFADFFGINYPGEKLDLIAIPDFASGAMENFGAITFRETALLLDETKATHAELQRVAEVISHENAHMWFGDLVTMDWWNGLWLNEAFATFMAALAVDAFEPSWKFWEGFNIHKAAAMRIDGLHSSRSIEFPVATPEDARAMFDILTYEKGCAILRMLQLYIGEEVFRKGCATYMKRHAYANTETADLWAAIGEAVHEAGLAIDVEKMMDTWVFQKGFPLIAVQRNENNSVTLSQSAFRYLIDARASAEEIWYAPVFVRYATASGDKHDCFVLFKKQETFKLKDKCSSFVLNADGKGFFRGSYASDLRKEILAQIITLSASERFNLISDWWAATQSGKMSLLDYLDSLSSVLAQETDSNVFSVVIGSINYLRRICAASSPDKMPQFVNAASELLEPALNRLGWEAKHNEEPQAAELRASLISTLGSLGQKNCVEKTAAMWQQYLADPNSDLISPNLLPAIVETTAANGDAACYEQMLKLKSSAKTPQEETRFLYALASFRKAELIQRTLAATINGEIRVQDAPTMLRLLFLNPAGAQLTWNFVTKNWNQLVAKLPLQGIIRLCDGITALIDPQLEQTVIDFFATNNIKGNEKALAQNLESLSVANQFLLREADKLKQRLG